jgi:hypothetical protein
MPPAPDVRSRTKGPSLRYSPSPAIEPRIVAPTGAEEEPLSSLVRRRTIFKFVSPRRFPEQVSGRDVPRRMAPSPLAMIGRGGEVPALARGDELMEAAQLPEAQVERHLDQRASGGQRIAVEARAEAPQAGQERPFDPLRQQIARETRRQDEIHRALESGRPVARTLGARPRKRTPNLGRGCAASGRSVAPGKGQRGADVVEPMTDARPDPAADIDVHFATVAFPLDDLGAERPDAQRAVVRVPLRTVDRCLRHPVISDERESSCVSSCAASTKNATRKSRHAAILRRETCESAGPGEVTLPPWPPV